MKPRLLAKTVAALVFSACVVDPAVPPQAEITCATSKDCPEGLVCLSNAKRCADPDPADDTPPALVHVTSLPERARAGTTLVLTFTIDESLIVDPEVVLAGSAESFPWQLDESGTDRSVHTFTHTRVLTGSEGASGAELRVEIRLIDVNGNESTYEAGRVVLDLDAPRLIDFTWDLPAWKSAARNEIIAFQAHIAAPATVETAVVKSIGGDVLAPAPVAWTVNTANNQVQMDGTVDLASAELTDVAAIRVELNLSDDLGNVGIARSGFLAVDVAPPSDPLVTTDATTETQQIEVYVAAMGANSVRFEGDVFDAATWHENELPTSLAIVLSAGLGAKELSAVFRDRAGNLVQSDPVTVEWVPAAVDETAPGISLVSATSATTVDVAFTEQLDPVTAQVAANYAIAGLTISNASLDANGQTVHLTTLEDQVPATPYELTVVAVEDLAGNAMVTEQRWFFGFGTADETAPELLYPDDGSVLLIADPDEPPGYDPNAATSYETIALPTLSWTPRIGATSYSVEIALDAGFAQAIPGSPFVVDAPATTLILVPSNAEPAVRGGLEADSPLEARTYHWRVTADVTTEPGLQRSFAALANTIYVHCPESEPTCSAATGSGNVSSPYQTISAGTAAARATGIARVLVAERGGTAHYPGPVHIEPGVSVFGGYTASFAEVDRDVAARRAIVRSSASFALFALDIVGQSTVVEGLELYGADGGDSYGIFTVNADDSLTFQNCGAHGGDTDGVSSSTGAYNELLVAGPGPRYVSVRLEGGSAFSSTALSVSGAAVDVDQSTLVGGEGIYTSGPFFPYTRGVSMSGHASVTITDSVIDAASAVAANGIGEGISGIGHVELVRGTVSATGLSTISRGLRVYDHGVVLEDSTVDGGAGDAVYVWMRATPEAVIVSGSTLTSDGAALDIRAGEAGSTTDVLATSVISRSSLVGFRALGLFVSTAGSHHVAEVTNSVLRAQDDDYAAAISAEQSDSLLLSNNTIAARTSAGTASIGFDLVEGAAILANNIVVLDGGTTRIGMSLDSPAAPQIVSFENNVFWDVTGGAGFVPYDGTVNNISGNLADLVGGSGLFADYAGGDLHLAQNAVADADWLNIRFGGKDTSQATCGTGNQSCGDVVVDRDDQPRTLGSTTGTDIGTNENAAGYSIGAYEHDGS